MLVLVQNPKRLAQSLLNWSTSNRPKRKQRSRRRKSFEAVFDIHCHQKSTGTNCINVSMHYRQVILISTSVYTYLFSYRDKIVEWENYRNWRQMVHYNPSKPYEVSEMLCLSKRKPHFKELFIVQAFHRFVALLTDTKLESNLLFAGQRGGGNVHLEYFWRRCDLCHIHFDVVANLETFQLDSQYILDKAKVRGATLQNLSLKTLVVLE